MKRSIEDVDRVQGMLSQEHPEDCVGEDNPVRVIDVFVDELDLGGLGLERVGPEATGRPPARPARSRHKARLVGNATPLMGAINSPMNRLRNSLTEIALSVLAYNLTPVKTSSASAADRRDQGPSRLLFDNKSHRVRLKSPSRGAVARQNYRPSVKSAP